MACVNKTSTAASSSINERRDWGYEGSSGRVCPLRLEDGRKLTTISGERSIPIPNYHLRSDAQPRK